MHQNKVTKKMWHKWFAWYPVETETNKVAWLQYVWRKPITIIKEVYTDGPEYNCTVYEYLKLTDSWIVK